MFSPRSIKDHECIVTRWHRSRESASIAWTKRVSQVILVSVEPSVCLRREQKSTSLSSYLSCLSRLAGTAQMTIDDGWPLANGQWWKIASEKRGPCRAAEISHSVMKEMFLMQRFVAKERPNALAKLSWERASPAPENRSRELPRVSKKRDKHGIQRRALRYRDSIAVTIRG